MKKIRIIIEKNEDGYWAYAENERGITGGGDTVQECKQDVMDAIETMKSFNAKNRPSFLDKEYQLVYKFDTESLLNYYKGIFTNAAFEKLTGINQKQIQHYATGLKKPRAAQTKKIEEALHTLGQELMAVEL
ncbi:MAG: type II toxin-antitoxin system HicB family antitoxin [Chitinophagaceae bacterium]